MIRTSPQQMLSCLTGACNCANWEASPRFSCFVWLNTSVYLFSLVSIIEQSGHFPIKTKKMRWESAIFEKLKSSILQRPLQVWLHNRRSLERKRDFLFKVSLVSFYSGISTVAMNNRRYAILSPLFFSNVILEMYKGNSI